VPEIATFDALKAEAAFRFLQDGRHIGKVVISLPRELDTIYSPAHLSCRTLQFEPAGSYLLIGGLGGLGRVTATWLVERGARSLTFLSRRAQSEENAGFIGELEAMGCKVVAVSGAAENLEDVERAIKESHAPIKGVFHMVMALEVSPPSPP